MSEEKIYRFNYTFEEFDDSISVFFRRDRRFYIVIVAIVLPIILAFSILPIAQALPIVAGFGAFMGFVFLWLSPAARKRTFREEPLWRTEQIISYNTDGIKIENGPSPGLLRWNTFSAVWDTKPSYILFYNNGKNFFSIPKRVFPSNAEREDFEKLIFANISKKKMLCRGKE